MDKKAQEEAEKKQKEQEEQPDMDVDGTAVLADSKQPSNNVSLSHHSTISV